MRTVFFLAVLSLLISCNSKKPAAEKENITADFAVTNSSFVNPDSVLFSFVFVGCNRLEKGDITKGNTSTANLPELLRTFYEIDTLNPRPVYFFFLGDLVYGLDTDLKKLGDQLRAWKAIYDTTALGKSGIQLITGPGNHEMLYDAGKGSELPNKGALDTFLNVMGNYMPKGVTINHVDTPHTKDNRMTYSFTYLNTHFIYLNKDT